VFLAEITLEQAISPIATHFSIATLTLSVCSSVVCHLSHLCTLFKPFDRFTCYLAGPIEAAMTYCFKYGLPILAIVYL